MRTKRTGLLFVAVAAAFLGSADAAQADESIIRIPDDHPLYHFEAEPHGLIGYGGPFDRGRAEAGVGFRGTVIIVDNGFVKSINNSVGIGFGGDIFFPHGVFYIPVVMQWNFWLTTHWSVFGEPGIGIAANPEANRDTLSPVFLAGARYHFNDRVSLTMRIGYPALSIGVSFFL